MPDKIYMKMTIPDIEDRVVAGLFQTPEGYVFFDIDWAETFAHPAYIIGRLIKEGKNRWEFEKGVMTPIAEDDPLWDEADDWFAYAGKQGYNDDGMINYLVKDFDFDPAKIKKF